jgi:hypothetical protein
MVYTWAPNNNWFDVFYEDSWGWYKYTDDTFTQFSTDGKSVLKYYEEEGHVFDKTVPAVGPYVFSKDYSYLTAYNWRNLTRLPGVGLGGMCSRPPKLPLTASSNPIWYKYPLVYNWSSIGAGIIDVFFEDKVISYDYTNSSMLEWRTTPSRQVVFQDAGWTWNFETKCLDGSKYCFDATYDILIYNAKHYVPKINGTNCETKFPSHPVKQSDTVAWWSH